MSKCTYNINGREVESNELENQPVSFFSLRHTPKEWITTKEAMKIVKAWLPNAIIEGPGAWLKFIPNLIDSQIDNPVEPIFAKISEGAIQIQTSEDNKVVKQMLMHEIVHLVYKYGMSTKWKDRLDKALKDNYGDTFSNLSTNAKEHLIASIYENTSTKSSKLAEFFNQLKALFNFFLLNRKDLKTLGKLIKSGYFSRNVTNIELDYEANYSFIKKYFGNIATYENAKAWLMSRFDYYQNFENTIDVLPFTREEILLKLRSEINAEQKELQDTKEAYQKAMEEAATDLELAKVEGEEASFIKELQQAHTTTVEAYNNVSSKLSGLSALVSSSDSDTEHSPIVQTIKDIFPNWSLSEEVIERIDERYSDVIKDEEAINVLGEGQDTNTEGIKNETEVKERQDQKSKTSTTVKDFLSFIKITNASDPYSLDNYVDFGWAFNKMAQLFDKYIDLNDLTIDRISILMQSIRKSEGENTWTVALLDKFENLLYSVLEYPQDAPTNVAIRMHQHGVTKEIYYSAYVAKNTSVVLSKLSGAYLFEQARKGKNSPWEFKHIKASERGEKTTLEQLYEFIKQYHPQLEIVDFNDMWRHSKAVNIVKEFHNHLGSLNEREYYIATTRYKGFKDFRPSYVPSSGLTSTEDLKNQVTDAFLTAITNKNIKPELHGGLIAKSAKIQRAAVLKFIGETLGLAHVLIDTSFSDKNINELGTTLNELIKAIPKEADKATELDLIQWAKNTHSNRFATISRTLGKESKQLRATSVLDASKNKIFKHAMSSFMIKTLKVLSSVSSAQHSKLTNVNYKGGTKGHTWKSFLVPEFIYTKLYQLNPITLGIQKLHSDPAHHDATYNPFSKKAWTFSRETSKIWWQRGFVMGFLEGINRSQSKNSTYYQFLYQPSDNSRISHVKLDVLHEADLKKSIGLLLQKLHYIQNVEGKPVRYINASMYKNALTEQYLKQADSIPSDVLIDTIYANMQVAAAIALQEVAPYNLSLPFNLATIMKDVGLTVPVANLQELSESNMAALQPLFELWYINNMVNGYFLNELVSGNPEYYSKKAIDIVKRQSGALGPQIKPLVGIFGSAKTFKAWIVKDSTLPLDSDPTDKEAQSIRSFLEGFFSNMDLSAEELTAEVNRIKELFSEKGFKLTDGAAFMSPSRWHDLSNGFGDSFGLGNVMKPMHFEIHTSYRPAPITFDSELEANEFLKANPGVYYGDNKGNPTLDPTSNRVVFNEETGKSKIVYQVYVAISQPVYIKYAVMVLSDEVLGVYTNEQGQQVYKYPLLYKLRQIMEHEQNNIGELIFESAVKLGAPAQLSDLKGIFNTAYADHGYDGLHNYKVPSTHVLELSNRYYGFQFNPTTKSKTKVAQPTQLQYLANLLDSNTDRANTIYNAISFINEIRYNRTLKEFKDKTVKGVIGGLFNDPGTARVQHLLSDGASLDTPAIEGKAITQLASYLKKTIISNNMPGGKLILQTTEGITKKGARLADIIEKKHSAEKLKYYRDSKGKAVAEAIVPFDLLTEDQRDIVKNGGEVYLLGFRIPSTEIHSSIVLKVVDFYDYTGTNVIIIPGQAMEIQGADFDVDSLFTLTPELFKKDVTIGDINYVKGEPVGYNLNDDALGHTFNWEELDALLVEQIKEDPDNTSKYQDIQIQLANNIILQEFINIASDKVNADRMGAPISKEDFVKPGQVNGKDSGLKLLVDRGLAVYEDEWDLTKAEDSEKSHKAVSQGGQLVGVEANNIKSLAYLLKSGVGRISTIANKYITNWEVNGSAERLDAIRNTSLDGLRYTWQTLDALVNLCIDNVKDQALAKFHINSRTANMVSLMVALGIPVQDFALISGTKIWRTLASDNFKTFKAALTHLATEEYTKDKDFFTNLRKGTVPTKVLSFDVMSNYLRIEAKEESKRTAKEQKEYILVSHSLLDNINKWSTLGGYLKTVSEVLTSLRDSPVTVEEIFKLNRKISQFLGYDLNNPSDVIDLQAHTLPDTNEGIKSFKQSYEATVPSVKNTAPNRKQDFPYFDTREILKAYPHIFTALRNIQLLKTLIQQEFKIHHPSLEAITTADVGFTTDFETDKHQTNVRRALSKHLINSLLAAKVSNKEGEITRWKNEKEKDEEGKVISKQIKKTTRNYQGARFWIEDFINRVALLQQADKDFVSKYKHLGFKSNYFLSHLTLSIDPTKGYRDIKVYNGATFDNSNTLKMEEGFMNLHRFKFDNTGNRVLLNSDLNPAELNEAGFTSIQEDFLTYNMLTSGLNYGVTNYSTYLPHAIYAEIERDYLSKLDEVIANYHLKWDTNIVQSLLYGLYLKVAISNIDRMPKITVNRKVDDVEVNPNSPVTLVQNKVKTFKRTTIEDFSINKGTLDTVDGKTIHYDLLFSVHPKYAVQSASILKKQELKIQDEEEIEEEEQAFNLDEGNKLVKFPLLIRKSDTIYVRVAIEKNKIAYQYVGNTYAEDSSILTDPLKYNHKYYFSPYIRTIPVDDTNVRTMHRNQVNLDAQLKDGSTVRLSNKSNIYRIQEQFVKVVSFDKNKETYTFEPTTEVEIEETPIARIDTAVARNPTKAKAPSAKLPPINTGEFSIVPELDSIEEEGRKWEDTKTEVNGVEVIQQYEHETTKEKVVRLTEPILSPVNKLFRRVPNVNSRHDKILADAEKAWEKLSPTDTLLFPNLSSKPVTKQEYIDQTLANDLKWAHVGTASHYLMQAAVQKTQALVDKYSKEAGDLLDSVGMDRRIVDWIPKKANAILEKAGINTSQDDVRSEVRIGSTVWGMGSTIDLLAKHIDNTFSIVDFKFGMRFNRNDSPFMMKYGQQVINIYQSPKEIAKLEVMLRAMMLKTIYPNMQFKNLMVNWVPSEYEADNYVDFSRYVEVESYMGMIKQVLKAEYDAATAEAKSQTIYGKLLNVPHFNRIFDKSEYTVGYSLQPNNKEIIEKGKSADALYQKYMQELRLNIQYELNPYLDLSDNSPRAYLKRERIKRAQELTQLILDLRKSQGIDGRMDWKSDVGFLSLWLTSNREQTNPYITIYSQLLDQQKITSNRRYEAVLQLYNAYAEPLLDLYWKRPDTGVKPTGLTGQKGLAGIWNNIDPTKFWEWAYVQDPNAADNTKSLLVTEEDWAKAAKMYPYIAENGVVKKEYKQMLNFMQDSWSQFFLDSKAYYNKKAMANRPATYQEVDGIERIVTDLDLHLNPRPGQQGKTWEYTRGWWAKVPVTEDEMGNVLTKKFDKRYWREVRVKYFSSIVEDEFLQDNSTNEAIPWRYLGNAKIESEGYYSNNLQESFLQSMKYYIHKEELTDVYTFAKGMVETLRPRNNMGNTIKYLEMAMSMQIRGIKQRSFNGGFFTKDIPIIRTVDGKAERPDWVKILRGIKTAGSAPIMALKPFQGISNGVFISLYTLKEAIKDSVVKAVGAKKFWSIDQNQTSFSITDLKDGYVEYGKMVMDGAKGDLHKNALWAIAKELNYVPDNFDIYADRNQGRVTRGRIWDQSTLYMFHSVPEEAMAMVILAAQLKSMKIKSTDSKNGRSLMSMYSMVPRTNDDGVTTYELKWEDDYVRGLLEKNKDPNNLEYEEIKGLTVDEARRMYYVYQRMHGGYRPDERVMFEYFILGEIFMQFKRYLPSLLRNYVGSQGKVQPYGYYKPKIDPETGETMLRDGKEVMEWHSRIIEGRFKTLAGLFINWFATRVNAGENLTRVQKLTTWLGITELESYNWDQLPEAQREVLIDFAITMAMWGALVGGYLLAGGGAGDDKDDPLLNFYARINRNFSQQVNPLEPLRDLTSNGWPSSFKVVGYRLQAATDVTAAAWWLALQEEDKALTRQGTLKGSNQFIKYWMPLGGSYYDFVKLVLGEPYVDEFTYRIKK